MSQITKAMIQAGCEAQQRYRNEANEGEVRRILEAALAGSSIQLFPSKEEIRRLAELALAEMQEKATTDREAWIASYEKVIMSYRRLALAKQQLADSTTSPPPHGLGGDDDHMIQIEDLISQLEAIHDRFGNTCVYIRRQGMGWGAVALNRRDDDKKNGVFDLQAQHDRDMHARLEQLGRLKKDRAEAWRQRRDAEGSRDAARAAADTLKIERNQLRKVVEELKFALFSSDMTIKDRADQSARLVLDLATATEGSGDA
ncbi:MULTISPECIES: hypothetical protein [unclassified Rhizobium]|uniref:hypothetical protein n=1 Tax=unclassified Rhizobium TaxID=2613769 RepID=UPI001614C18F|nr:MULTISPECIES: hypothetical protein [unclassified Rhizobium]MBB3297834.1 hypothetical protein [Rhizobium sp. BK112]MBB4177671.1 hypothetical protein [Rhizobium sp. BK109]